MKPSATRKWLYLLLGTTVTIVLLSWTLKDVSPAAIWTALKVVRLEWLGVGWFAYIASYWVRARRWGTLLAATCDPGRFKTRLSAIFIGFGASSVLPAYCGEFARAAVLTRLDQVPLEAAIGSLFAERLLDVGVVFLFLLLPLWLGGLPQNTQFNQLPLGWLGAAIFVIWFVFLIGASYPVQVTRLLGAVSQRVGLGRFRVRLMAGMSGFLNGLSALRQPRRTTIALLETVCIWSLNGITYWSGLMAFGITSPGFLGALLTQSTTALAIALPSTPGYIGAFEAGIRFALSVYAIPLDTMIAYAIALRFIMYVTIPAIAGILLTFMSVSILDVGSLLRHSSKQPLK